MHVHYYYYPHRSVVQVKGNNDDIWWTDCDEQSWYELDQSCLHIFSKCLLSLLLFKESLDGATLESAHFNLDDDEYLAVVHFYTMTPSLSHGDLVFDSRSDLSQERGDDAEHPMDITMSRVRSASDTCDIYFTYTKVSHILYMCSLDPFEDGILLDTPPCACICIVGTS